jgi:hypothetical protein
MKTLLENWNNFIKIEEGVEVPSEIEQSDEKGPEALAAASAEADNIIKKVTAASNDPDIQRQTLETMVRKLIDFYKNQLKK